MRGYLGISRTWRGALPPPPAIPPPPVGRPLGEGEPAFYFYVDAWRLGQPTRRVSAGGPTPTAWPLTEPYNAFDRTARAQPGAFVRQYLWDSYQLTPHWTLQQARFV